jgi:DNA-binding CsgD family transcriptional regulator
MKSASALLLLGETWEPTIDGMTAFSNLASQCLNGVSGLVKLAPMPRLLPQTLADAEQRSLEYTHETIAELLMFPDNPFCHENAKEAQDTLDLSIRIMEDWNSCQKKRQRGGMNISWSDVWTIRRLKLFAWCEWFEDISSSSAPSVGLGPARGSTAHSCCIMAELKLWTEHAALIRDAATHFPEFRTPLFKRVADQWNSPDFERQAFDAGVFLQRERRAAEERLKAKPVQQSVTRSGAKPGKRRRNVATRPLTPRQSQCLQLYAIHNGAICKIAGEMKLTHSTVNQHLNAAWRKIPNLAPKKTKAAGRSQRLPTDHRGQANVRARPKNNADE